MPRKRFGGSTKAFLEWVNILEKPHPFCYETPKKWNSQCKCFLIPQIFFRTKRRVNSAQIPECCFLSYVFHFSRDGLWWEKPISDGTPKPANLSQFEPFRSVLRVPPQILFSHQGSFSRKMKDEIEKTTLGDFFRITSSFHLEKKFANKKTFTLAISLFRCLVSVLEGLQRPF